MFGVEFSVLHRPHISFAIGTMGFLVAIDLLPIFIFSYFFFSFRSVVCACKILYDNIFCMKNASLYREYVSPGKAQ